MTYKFLTTRREGSVEHLTLNRPNVRNAFNAEFIGELTAWAASVSQPDRPSEPSSKGGVRVVVLSGAGKTFCAGADIAWMAETIGYTEAQNLSDAVAASRMFAAIDTVPVPVIARVHGAALGGGAGLAAVCDIVVAEEAALFGFTEVKLGLLPAVISPFVIAKIGRSAARELFLTGARFSAGRAREIGLVHQVVPARALDDTVGAYVRGILEAGPEALAAAKALIPEVAGRPLDEARAASAAALAKRRVSAEGQEGLRAFLEKRTPNWFGRKSTTEDTEKHRR